MECFATEIGYCAIIFFIKFFITLFHGLSCDKIVLDHLDLLQGFPALIISFHIGWWSKYGEALVDLYEDKNLFCHKFIILNGIIRIY